MSEAQIFLTIFSLLLMPFVILIVALGVHRMMYGVGYPPPPPIRPPVRPMPPDRYREKMQGE